MITVTEIIQTCLVAPCQWEGRTDDDRPVYIRLRSGKLSVRVGKKDGSIMDAVSGQIAHSQSCGPGDEADFVEYERLRELLADVVLLPETCELVW